MTYTIVWRSGGEITTRDVEAESPQTAWDAFKLSKPPGGVPGKGELFTNGRKTDVMNGESKCLVVILER